MPPGKLPSRLRSNSSPYHSIPLVLIARLLRMVSPLGGAVPAGRLVVAPRGGPIGLLRKPMVDDARPSAAARSLLRAATWSGRRGSNPRPSAWEAEG